MNVRNSRESNRRGPPADDRELQDFSDEEVEGNEPRYTPRMGGDSALRNSRDLRGSRESLRGSREGVLRGSREGGVPYARGGAPRDNSRGAPYNNGRGGTGPYQERGGGAGFRNERNQRGYGRGPQEPEDDVLMDTNSANSMEFGGGMGDTGGPAYQRQNRRGPPTSAPPSKFHDDDVNQNMSRPNSAYRGSPQDDMARSRESRDQGFNGSRGPNKMSNDSTKLMSPRKQNGRNPEDGPNGRNSGRPSTGGGDYGYQNRRAPPEDDRWGPQARDYRNDERPDDDYLRQRYEDSRSAPQRRNKDWNAHPGGSNQWQQNGQSRRPKSDYQYEDEDPYMNGRRDGPPANYGRGSNYRDSDSYGEKNMGGDPYYNMARVSNDRSTAMNSSADRMSQADRMEPMNDDRNNVGPSSNSSRESPGEFSGPKKTNNFTDKESDDFEVVPKNDPTIPMVQCLIVRRRVVLQRITEYQLYLQGDRKKGHEKLILVARKQAQKQGCSYHIYNVSRGHLGGRLNKKGGNYVGKLKCSGSKIENVMYNNEEKKQEVGGVMFMKPSIMDHMRDGAQPRKLKLIVPPINEKNCPIPQPVKFNDPYGGLLAQIQVDEIEQGCSVFERKEPVFENGNYRLNFRGRVTVPSVKNFQLVSTDDVSDIKCQFGKVADDRFHLDFKHPMNAFQAFCVCLAQFNY